jgi:hypothetical protein
MSSVWSASPIRPNSAAAIVGQPGRQFGPRRAGAVDQRRGRLGAQRRQFGFGEAKIVRPRDLVLGHRDAVADLRQIFAEPRRRISASTAPNSPASSSRDAQPCSCRSAPT